MPALSQSDSVSSDLAQAIERQIRLRTGRRIHPLDVAVTADRVIVQGRAPSYYLKQLALQAVLDVLGQLGPGRLEMSIEVTTARPV